MKRRQFGLIASAAILWASVPADPGAQTGSFAKTLAQPGVHAIMRHALAPGGGDPARFALGDCSTQRNLDDRGRAQARMIGETLRKMDADFDGILTSQWCRCVDTAQLLGLGPVEKLPALNSFFADRSTAGAQTEDLRRYLDDLPKDAQVMLVTHQVNITALLDVFPSSGEVFLFRIGADGAVEILGNLEIDP